MIDRRVFLKGIIGAGLSFELLSNPKVTPISKITHNKYEREEYLAGLKMPEVSLVVKVHEVNQYDTDEFEVCGSCLIAFNSVPVRVCFFINRDARNTSMPSDFNSGSMFLMTGALYLYENQFGVNMIAPEFKQIEKLLTEQEIEDFEKMFAADLLCRAIKDGAEIVIKGMPKGEKEVVWKDGFFRPKKDICRIIGKEQFVQHATTIPGDPISISLCRSDLLPEYQGYSDTQIAHKLGNRLIKLTVV